MGSETVLVPTGSDRHVLSGPQKNAYTSSTWWYDLRGFFILTFAYRDSLSSQIDFFSGRMRERHLEVGIGTGTLFRMILKRHRRRQDAARHIVGVDYSPEMLAGAARKLANDRAVSLRQADARILPYADASFDSVSIANSLHCFADVRASLREIHRVLRPGGSFAANAILHPAGWTPSRWLANKINRWGMKKGILFAPLDAAELRADLSACGFEVRAHHRRGNDFFIEARKP